MLDENFMHRTFVFSQSCFRSGHMLAVGACESEQDSQYGCFRFSGVASRLRYRDGMKLALIPLALISLIALAMSFAGTWPAKASSNHEAEQIAAGSCVDRYNSLLKSAKAALIAGDRKETVGFLAEAKSLVPVCPALREIGSLGTPLLTLNTCDECRA